RVDTILFHQRSITKRRKIMDSRRSLLVIALLFISFLVYQQWQLDYHTPKPVATEQVKVSSDVPASSASSSSDIATTAQAQGRISHIRK
ncbi:membrane protein insertase, partial [Pasteurella multocida subsp. multocida str. Anand1_cattle]